MTSQPTMFAILRAKLVFPDPLGPPTARIKRGIEKYTKLESNPQETMFFNKFTYKI